MAWFAEISRPTPGTDDVKVAGAPVADRPAYADGATTAEDLTAEPAYDGAAYDREYGETAYLPEGEVTRDEPPPVPTIGTVRKRKRRPARRSRRRIKVLGVAIVVTVVGGAVDGWVLTAGPGRKEPTRPSPVRAQGPPPLTDAQRAAAEAMRLKELRRRASRAARQDDSRPLLYAKGTPRVTKKPETSKPAPPPDTGGPTPVGEAQRIAKAMLPDYGWSPSTQFGCLVDLWNKESGWNTHAANPSGAYGIPQALPGSKMASAGADWQNNARTQIKWGLGYIRDRYGTPCAAWQHSQATGWY